MGTNADAPLSPWVPITDLVDLKHLGKLGEETGELSSAVARCIIQGMDGVNPDGGQVNREWLEDEIADVLANAALNIQHFKLDWERIKERRDKKMARLKTWHSMEHMRGE
jgi:NTP pyrophosphatase (non-canonical NTP hydrolase)